MFVTFILMLCELDIRFNPISATCFLVCYYTKEGSAKHLPNFKMGSHGGWEPLLILLLNHIKNIYRISIALRAKISLQFSSLFHYNTKVNFNEASAWNQILSHRSKIKTKNFCKRRHSINELIFLIEKMYSKLSLSLNPV